MPNFSDAIRYICRSMVRFSDGASGVTLRAYQVRPAEAIIDSVLNRRGLTFVVIFPRQSGKNELQAQIEAYLLTLYSMREVEMVKVSPTWKPQGQTAMRRLESVLSKNFFTSQIGWSKESGYIYRVGKARVHFLSGTPDSHIVGATASLLLEVDEAQDVSCDKFDKEIAPMAASTNATRVFWGTAWTGRTLLARELAAAQAAEKEDGIPRTFILTADEVAAEVPQYGTFVQEQVARLGRNNPMVKTQFYSEAIDAEGGMFNTTRQALMQGTHPPQDHPAGADPAAGPVRPIYAITIDVAGEDESARDEPSASLQNPGRDSTALTIFEVDTRSVDDPLVGKPVYKTVCRQQWTGIKHTSLFGRLTAIIDLWSPAWVVVDATGVGQTISSFLFERYPNVLPFTFTSASKSQLGWDFLTIIETGRYKEYARRGSSPYQGGAGGGSDPHSLQSTFWLQADNCQYHILEGPGHLMRWGVPDGTRDPVSGELIHDDLLVSAALVSQLDGQSFGQANSTVMTPPDLFDKKDF